MLLAGQSEPPLGRLHENAGGAVPVAFWRESDSRNSVSPMDWVDLNYRPHAYQVSPRWCESRQEIV